jgi:hypothetical protein
MRAEHHSRRDKAKPSKALIVAAPLILCALVTAADGTRQVSHHGDGTASTFAEATTYFARNTEYFEVKESILFAASGMLNGDPVKGSVFWNSSGTHEVGEGTVIHFSKGSAMPAMSTSLNDIAAVVGLILLILVVTLAIVRGDIRSLRPRAPLGWRAVHAAARLLPPTVQDEYVEEWTAWLRDLRAGGARWPKIVVEVLSIVLVAAPRLAMTLRLLPDRTAS